MNIRSHTPAATRSDASTTGPKRTAVSLPREPWHVEAAPKPPLPRPVETSIYIARERALIGRRDDPPADDEFSQWDQDLLAEEWADDARRAGHAPRAFVASDECKSAGASGGRKNAAVVSRFMVRLLEHLRLGDDTRNGAMAALRCGGGLYSKNLQLAKDMGWVKATKMHQSTLLSLTSNGHRALAMMKLEAR